MKSIFLLAVVLALGLHSAFAQYDYEDNDLKKPQKLPKEEKGPRQSDGKGFELSKLSVGGMFNFSYGGGYYDGLTEYTNFLYLEISPMAAYQLIEDRLDLGVGIIYQFQRYDYTVNPPYGFRGESKSSTYGGRIFPRVYIFRGLFAQLSYVIQNGEVLYLDPYTGSTYESRKTYHNAFAGAGYKFPIGGKAYFTLLADVNLNVNDLYPTRQLYLSFGFGVGL